MEASCLRLKVEKGETHVTPTLVTYFPISIREEKEMDYGNWKLEGRKEGRVGPTFKKQSEVGSCNKHTQNLTWWLGVRGRNSWMCCRLYCWHKVKAVRPQLRTHPIERGFFRKWVSDFSLLPTHGLLLLVEQHVSGAVYYYSCQIPPTSPMTP